MKYQTKQILWEKFSQGFSVIESQSKRADVMSILPGNKAPWFSSIGFQENKFMDTSINDYTGKWLVLFFYPPRLWLCVPKWAAGAGGSASWAGVAGLQVQHQPHPQYYLHSILLQVAGHLPRQRCGEPWLWSPTFEPSNVMLYSSEKACMLWKSFVNMRKQFHFINTI